MPSRPAPKEAIVLAAGVGSRLASRHGGAPKCLVPVAGTPILIRQLLALQETGVTRVVVVTGYERRQVEDAALKATPALELEFVHNEAYRETNVLASWFCGSAALTGDHFYLHGDTVFEPALLQGLKACGKGDVWLTVDQHSCGDEEMKVIEADGQIRRISKELDPRVVLGEFTGILRANNRALHALRELAAELLRLPDGRRFFFERALQEGIDRGLLDVRWADVSGMKWREIDFPEDLDAASSLFAG